MPGVPRSRGCNNCRKIKKRVSDIRHTTSSAKTNSYLSAIKRSQPAADALALSLLAREVGFSVGPLYSRVSTVTGSISRSVQEQVPVITPREPLHISFLFSKFKMSDTTCGTLVARIVSSSFAFWAPIRRWTHPSLP
jgi:hypothetical protein